MNKLHGTDLTLAIPRVAWALSQAHAHQRSRNRHPPVSSDKLLTPRPLMSRADINSGFKIRGRHLPLGGGVISAAGVAILSFVLFPVDPTCTFINYV